MTIRIIGRCSICGGNVVAPTGYLSTLPPVPTCQSCGATASRPELPVVPMEPRRFTTSDRSDR